MRRPGRDAEVSYRSTVSPSAASLLEGVRGRPEVCLGLPKALSITPRCTLDAPVSCTGGFPPLEALFRAPIGVSRHVIWLHGTTSFECVELRAGLGSTVIVGVLIRCGGFRCSESWLDRRSGIELKRVEIELAYPLVRPGSLGLILKKKIGDIPEERRHRLLSTVKGRKTSYLPSFTSLTFLLTLNQDLCLLIGLMTSERLSSMARTERHMDEYLLLMLSNASGGSLPFGLDKYYSPLYFKVTPIMEVMSTEQPCDVAYEFGNGLLDPWNIPAGFTKPGKTNQLVDNKLLNSIGSGI
ncbi:hypothetical protein BHE74_00003251 [Ensete ventricosum]|nr:hypothetical protein BHE74_00003251 [Ensete ventricosum]